MYKKEEGMTEQDREREAMLAQPRPSGPVQFTDGDIEKIIGYLEDQARVFNASLSDSARLLLGTVTDPAKLQGAFQRVLHLTVFPIPVEIASFAKPPQTVEVQGDTELPIDLDQQFPLGSGIRLP